MLFRNAMQYLQQSFNLSQDEKEERKRITSLKRKLFSQIDQSGPISFHDFMESSLYDPDAGFYIDRIIFSEEQKTTGDFLTAPKKFFPFYGEAIASLISQLHVGNKKKGGIQKIISIAGGDGTLDRDLLEWLQKNDLSFYQNMQYESIEISARQIALQKEVLGKHAKKVRFIKQSGIDYLHEHKQSLTHTFIFSNEWLDTLPVHIILKHKGVWQEMRITKNWKGEFAKTTGKLQDPEAVNKFLTYARRAGRTYDADMYKDYPINVHAKMIETAEALSQALISGFSLMIDYGTVGTEPTQSILTFSRNKKLKNFLQYPGSIDITTYIDWDIWLQASKPLLLESVTCDLLLIKYLTSLKQEQIDDSLQRQLKNPALLQSVGGYTLSKTLQRTLQEAEEESTSWFNEGFYGAWKHSPYPANALKTKLFYIKRKLLAGEKVK